MRIMANIQYKETQGKFSGTNVVNVFWLDKNLELSDQSNFPIEYKIGERRRR